VKKVYSDLSMGLDQFGAADAGMTSMPSTIAPVNDTYNLGYVVRKCLIRTLNPLLELANLVGFRV
jgi:hypothetical protein